MRDMSSTPELPCILVDKRERAPLTRYFSPDVIFENVTLETGDYSLRGASDRVAIERKSLPDLVACVGHERPRFIECCERLSKFAFRLMVVEANFDDVLAGAYRSRIRPACVVGTCIALHTDFGLPTIWCGDARNAANIVERLLTRFWRKQVLEAAS
jgi:DNA excision repair protein ERCC-4